MYKLTDEEKAIIDSQSKDEFLTLLGFFKTMFKNERYKGFKKDVLVDEYYRIPSEQHMSEKEFYEHKLKELEAFRIENQWALVCYGLAKFDLDDLYEDLSDFYHKEKANHVKKIKFLEELISKATPVVPNAERGNGVKEKDREWFKVLLRFADGTIKKLPGEDRLTFDKMTTEAGLSLSLRPYVSDTYNGNKNNGKNLFASKKKMEAVYQYCIKNNIPISGWFSGEYNKFK